MSHLLRELAPQVVAAVARRHGDFAAAEDAVQEALIAAATQWPVEGMPNNPRGWLYHAATRRLTDHVRSEMARRRREDVAATEWSAIALTLRAVGGLTTAEIANAFLVPEATMAQRISRAKQTIKTSNIPFRPPNDSERAERLSAVLHVLYLIFNEGYASSVGAELQRAELSNEAIRLTRAVHALLPRDGEVAGLLALMLLTDARRAARTGPRGEIIALDEQDRSLWDRRLVDEGVALISATLPRGSIGPYQLQAAIAAVHDEAPSTDETDWGEILALYGVLKRITDNPMVTLNLAIAASMVHGPATGLELLTALDGDARIAGHYRLDAVRAHLFEKSGDRDRALMHYRAAAEGTTSTPERNYLLTKAARLVSN